MRKIILALTLATICSTGFAQKTVTIKGGTIVPIAAENNIRASQVSEGQYVDFRVMRDVIVDGSVAIPAGTIVKGQVYEARRSLAFGIPGSLGIQIRYSNLPSGDTIPFTSSNITVRGSNRIALSVIIFCCTCVPLPCGSRAELKANVEYGAMVASDTTVSVE
jgi:hypothetical protein